MKPLTHPIPGMMKNLPVSKQGYPVPFIVLIDKEGVPQFRVNDITKEEMCAEQKLCGICGNKTRGEYWFIGGQLSAFHRLGVFNDAPLHHECAEFALKVCPYMVNSNYKAMTEDGMIKLEDKISDKTIKLFNPSIDNERLTVFCLCKAKRYKPIKHENGVYVFQAAKPYEQVEYYKDGQRIHRQMAIQLLRENGETVYIP